MSCKVSMHSIEYILMLKKDKSYVAQYKAFNEFELFYQFVEACAFVIP